MGMVGAGWSELPMELLNLIGEYVLAAPDYISFGAVSSSWRSVAEETRLKRIHKFFKDIDDETIINFHSVIINNNKLPLKTLNLPSQYYCCGSTLGWLVLIHDSLQMHLFNPFSGASLKLPCSTTIPNLENPDKYNVTKAFMSSDPTSSTSLQPMVLLIYEETPSYTLRLAFCKVGDKSWSLIQTEQEWFTDAIFHGNKLYVVAERGTLLVCDIVDAEKKPIFTQYAGYPPLAQTSDCKKYLVEANDDLFLVERTKRYDTPSGDDYYDTTAEDENPTVGFFVHKLVERSGIQTWEKVQSIGDNALFVGVNSSFSLSASNFSACNPNCIYFTDDKIPYDFLSNNVRADIGIFNIEDGNIDFPADPTPMRPPTFWFTPKPM